MLKDLINIERIELSARMFKIYFVKKYVSRTAADETFVIDNPAVLLMKSGSFKVQLKKINQDLKAHDLLVLPKNTSFTGIEAGSRLQFFLITFSSGINGHGFSFNQNDLFSSGSGNEAVKISLDENDYMVLSLICRLLYAEISGSLANEFEVKLQQISLNLLLFEMNLITVKYLSAGGMNFSRSESLASQFLTVLSIHCRKHHTVKFYAGVMYLSPEHLSKMVKDVTGKAAKKIITEAVVSEAVGLLENPHLTMAEIAEELEFSSVASFSIFFRKSMFCTPSEYRKNTIERFKSR
ncbi:helix-turn-helix domain-containing protein [Flavobacterium notoginsengisoli]|uniref:helix-turn-helix domain-containing protein n=1 Tax=Flavobacterium notoginsengisoli TaxID=1478199 RepID=UPI0036404D92